MSRFPTGASFIERMSTEALASTAVNHPYLDAFCDGSFPNIEFALKDFACQYGIYSAQFIRYLSAVIKNLESEEHQQILQTNVCEEKGDTHDFDLPADILASVAGQPHALLFRRFQEALGIDAVYRVTHQEHGPGQEWSRQYLRLCETDQCVAVGAVGLGTELIVSTIYQKILEGLKNHSQLTLDQRVFFDLHSHCDDEHAEQLKIIATELAQSPEACEKLTLGVHKAIELRTQFWDAMLERANTYSPITEAVTDLGYEASL